MSTSTGETAEQFLDRYRLATHEHGGGRVFAELDRIIRENPEPYMCEGSVWCLGGGSMAKTDVFEHKRRNLFKLASGASRILEIGFNAGHSAALMLLASPHSKLTLFDIGEHRYTRPALECLMRTFPGRVEAMYFGDSRCMLPAFVTSRAVAPPAASPPPFDLVHIDGGHTEDVLASDFECCARLVAPVHTVVIDDVDDRACPPVAQFVRRMVAEQRLQGPRVDGFWAPDGGEMLHFIGEYSAAPGMRPA